MDERKNRTSVILYVVIVTLIILAGVGIYQFKRANDLEISVENQYAHAFFELSDYVKDVDVLLKKSALVQSPGQLSALSSRIYMQSAAAKANLALLPVSGETLSQTSKFLSQVGDYTAFLSAKVISDGTISDEEFNSLEKLSEYATAVSDKLAVMEGELYSGQLTFTEKAGETKAYADDGTDFASGMTGIEEVFQDYPSLIYDGPFSEHIEAMEPAMLKNKPLFSQEEARQVADGLLEGNRGRTLVFSNVSEGKIPTYNFTSMPEENHQISISVTREGGYVLYMLDNRSVTERKISIDMAIEKAESFLKKQGFYHIKNSYYDEGENTATINFSAVQDGTVLYSDLIKVKVALDNGEIVGYEARGYLMNHQTRTFSQNILSEQEAKACVSRHLSVESAGLSLVPLDSMREVLCYEFKGKYKDNHFLIYINAETGREEKILMLQESEDGILTV